MDLGSVTGVLNRRSVGIVKLTISRQRILKTVKLKLVSLFFWRISVFFLIQSDKKRMIGKPGCFGSFRLVLGHVLFENLFNEYGIKENEVIVIISNSGRNGVIVDMALLCKEKGVKTVALTNLKHTYSGESRHKSGKRLCEIADVVLDNFGCVGDACVEIDGVEGKICPTSTVSGALILNAVVAEMVDICAKKGFVPEHFASSNVDGGDEINNKFVEKYKEEIKHL